MVVFLLAVFALAGQANMLIASIVIGYIVVLLPLVVSYVVLRFLQWQRLRAYAGVMFLTTNAFVLPLSLNLGVDYQPGISTNGFVLPPVIGAIGALCIAIFWRLAVRACRDSSEAKA